jgi:tRNA 2-selenouridine synthase
VSAQPAQIDFENQLAIDILKKRAAGLQLFVVEDEGRHVGRCAVPLELRQCLEQAPMVYVEEPFEARVERILRDYVVAQCADFCAVQGEVQGVEAFSARLLQSLDKLHKRLGGDRHVMLRGTMLDALAQQKAHGDVAQHRGWIAALLRYYYDPMYAYQRECQAGRTEFQGAFDQVLAYLRERAELSSCPA